MYVENTKEALTGRQILDRVQEEYLRKRIMSIMLLLKLGLCRGAYEWVSSRIIFQQEKEILSMALDFNFDIPCVVQWNLLWFSAPTDLNRILGTELKIEKYYEVVNGAINGRYCETIWRETHTEVVYVNLGGQSLTTHTKREELIKK